MGKSLRILEKFQHPDPPSPFEPLRPSSCHPQNSECWKGVVWKGGNRVDIRPCGGRIQGVTEGGRQKEFNNFSCSFLATFWSLLLTLLSLFFVTFLPNSFAGLFLRWGDKTRTDLMFGKSELAPGFAKDV